MLIAEAFDRGQVQHRAMMVGKRGETARDFAQPRMMFLRRVGLRRERIGETIVAPRFGRAAAGARYEDIVDDREQPAAAIAFGPKGIAPFDRAQQRILDYIVGILIVARERACICLLYTSRCV